MSRPDSIQYEYFSVCTRAPAGNSCSEGSICSSGDVEGDDAQTSSPRLRTHVAREAHARLGSQFMTPGTVGFIQEGCQRRQGVTQRRGERRRCEGRDRRKIISSAGAEPGRYWSRSSTRWAFVVLAHKHPPSKPQGSHQGRAFAAKARTKTALAGVRQLAPDRVSLSLSARTTRDWPATSGSTHKAKLVCTSVPLFPPSTQKWTRQRSQSADAASTSRRSPGPCSSHTLGSVGPAALLTMHGAQVVTSRRANQSGDVRDLRFLDRCGWGSTRMVVVC